MTVIDVSPEASPEEDYPLLCQPYFSVAVIKQLIWAYGPRSLAVYQDREAAGRGHSGGKLKI